MAQTRTTVPVMGVFVFLIVSLLGCASPQYTASDDALYDVRNLSLRGDQRLEAAARAWAQSEAGAIPRTVVREHFKTIAWSRTSPPELRLRVLGLLMSDASESGLADSKRLAGLMLPNETDEHIVALFSQTAGEGGWTELTGPLVRSYARRADGSAGDLLRPERVAIERLHPGLPAEVAIYRVFLDPGDGPTGASSKLNWAERTRSDAWSLLSKLDRDGSVRTRLIESGEHTGGAGADAIVADLRAARAQLGGLPGTGMAFDWLRSLRHHERAQQAEKNERWWGEAAGAIAQLGHEQRAGLAMRHAEPVRWAGAHKPGWLLASKGALLGELAARLGGRTRHTRSAEDGISRATRHERLEEWAPDMAWGDVLAMLVIDEALSSPGLAARVYEQAELDRKDRKTEYGGIIEAAGDAGAFRAVLFKPRAGDRTGDHKFVASEDMFRFGDRALAHFHLQVQQARNAKYAGPSPGDLDYARNSGRSCVVFTSVGSERVNVDVYTPGGAVVDLGEIAPDGGRR